MMRAAINFPPSRRILGVTLVELIIVITISGILATITAVFIVRSMEGYQSQVQRAALVDAADTALRRMARDIRRALPNSVRVAAGGTAIEMLNTKYGARYRSGPGQAGSTLPLTQYWLRTSAPDGDGFNIVGSVSDIATYNTGSADDIVVPFNSTTERLAVYNLGISPAVLCGGTGADAYSDANCGAGSRVVMTNPNVLTFSITNDATSNEPHITPAGGSFNFRWASPFQRVFVVDTPVTYLCAPGAGGTITRYQGYAITAAQPINPAITPLSGGTNGLLAMPVTACAFTYTPGTAQRAGLVTLDITVASPDGDTVRLLHQVHVDNAP